jgi:predicted PurR-regulated permease PerM
MDWAQILVIILAIFLALFLLAGIILLVLLIQITRQIKHITTTAQNTADAIESTVRKARRAVSKRSIVSKAAELFKSEERKE